MIKSIITGGIIIAAISLIGILIPDNFVQAIDDAFVYFLSAMYNLQMILNVSTVLICLQILANFYTAVATFFIIHWVMKAFR